MAALGDKTAFVTGGAGGLGKAICQALAREGARVAVGYNTAAKAEALVASLPAAHRALPMRSMAAHGAKRTWATSIPMTGGPITAGVMCS